MKVSSFEDLEVWKLARELTSSIYRITAAGKLAKDFGLRDQVRRASVSIMSNIAEGFERGGNREFIQFLAIAKGSCGEVRAQLYVALDQGYITQTEAEALIDRHRKLSIMIYNFLEKLKRSPFKGAKYKAPKQSQELDELDAMLKEAMKK